MSPTPVHSRGGLQSALRSISSIMRRSSSHLNGFERYPASNPDRTLSSSWSSEPIESGHEQPQRLRVMFLDPSEQLEPRETADQRVREDNVNVAFGKVVLGRPP